MSGRGEQIPRPRPWLVRAADRRAFQGWQQVLTTEQTTSIEHGSPLPAIPATSTSASIHLREPLGVVKVAGSAIEQWQYEVTGGGRIWYAIDDDNRTLWITRAGTGHPKQTDTRRR